MYFNNSSPLDRKKLAFYVIEYIELIKKSKIKYKCLFINKLKAIKYIYEFPYLFIIMKDLVLFSISFIDAFNRYGN